MEKPNEEVEEASNKEEDLLPGKEGDSMLIHPQQIQVCREADHINARLEVLRLEPLSHGWTASSLIGRQFTRVGQRVPCHPFQQTKKTP